jgi:hypothetical protein
MPATSKKFFRCWKDFKGGAPACRFCIIDSRGIGWCKRDPLHVECFEDKGCFVGEPPEARVCSNCGRYEMCNMYDYAVDEKIDTVWGCFSWEVR